MLTISLVREYKNFKDNIINTFNDSYNIFKENIKPENNEIFSFMNCSFIYSDLNMIYKSFYDLAKKMEIMTELVLCIAFFSLVSAIFLQLGVLKYRYEGFHDENEDQREDSLISKKKAPYKHEKEIEMETEK